MGARLDSGREGHGGRDTVGRRLPSTVSGRSGTLLALPPPRVASSTSGCSGPRCPWCPQWLQGARGCALTCDTTCPGASGRYPTGGLSGPCDSQAVQLGTRRPPGTSPLSPRRRAGLHLRARRPPHGTWGDAAALLGPPPGPARTLDSQRPRPSPRGTPGTGAPTPRAHSAPPCGPETEAQLCQDGWGH